jgi:hypothetical protein
VIFLTFVLFIDMKALINVNKLGHVCVKFLFPCASAAGGVVGKLPRSVLNVSTVRLRA